MATAAPRPLQPARSIRSNSSSVVDSPSAKLPSKSSKPISLSRRLLFPGLPPDADLPPLLASPSAAPLLNAELYDFIALALRAFVNPWWTKITRYDKEFLPAITRVVTAVVRALEARLVAADLAPLIFRDLPTLLTQHCTDFRNAQSKLNTSYASGGAATLPQLFHQLQPHMAISTSGRIDEVYIRQAIDILLKECLPPEDYESDAERFIVREIIVKVLLGSVVPRIIEPWFIHKLILDLMGPDKPKSLKTADTPHASSKLDQTTQRHAYSFQSLAIFFLSAIQSLSGACLALIHAYRQTRDTIRKVNMGSPRFPHQQPSRTSLLPTSEVEQEVAPGVSPATSFGLPGALMTSLPPERALRSTPPSHLNPSPTPSTSPRNSMSRSMSRASTPSAASTSGSSHATPTQLSPPPDYTQPPLTLLLTILFPPPLPLSSSATARPGSPSRSTALALAYTLSLSLTALSPFLSRLLPYLLYTHVLSVERITDIVRISRRTLFPEGWPAPPPVDPSPEEQMALRQELGRRLLASVPGPLAPLLGPSPAARSYTIDAALAPLSSRECNAHLMLFILDLVLLTVFPEMAASVSESADGAVSGEARPP